MIPASRPNCARIFASGSPVSPPSARMRRHCRSVSTREGWMQLTRTPSSLPRSAKHLVKAATAALTELPMVKRFSGLRPLVPAIATSAPRRSFNSGQAARESHMREEFQRIAVCPIGVGQFEEVAPLGCAGIVDEDVEAAEFALHRLDQRLGCAGLAQIEHADCGFSSLAADRRCHLLQRLRVTAGGQEIAAFLCESPG